MQHSLRPSLAQLDALSSRPHARALYIYISAQPYMDGVVGVVGDKSSPWTGWGLGNPSTSTIHYVLLLSSD